MDKIETLNRSGKEEVMLYKHKGDDGVLVKYSHGRMEWYRVDTREYIDIYSYSYYE